MSASNWAICPRCRQEAERNAEFNRQMVADLYGRVSVEEFDAARAGLEATLAKMLDEDTLSTFREDYEIFGASDGTVKVSYSGSCEVCGLSLDFEHEHAIPGLTPGGEPQP